LQPIPGLVLVGTYPIKQIKTRFSKISQPEKEHQKEIQQKQNRLYYQCRKALSGMFPENREATMGASIRSSQDLAERVSRCPCRFSSARIRTCRLILLTY